MFEFKIEIYIEDENPFFDETSSVVSKDNITFFTLLILGLLIKLMIFALLGLAMFGHFDTFPGVVRWVGEINNIDHLSPVETETRTELGNKKYENKYKLTLTWAKLTGKVIFSYLLMKSKSNLTRWSLRWPK